MKTNEMIKAFLRRHRTELYKPQCYLGQEVNSIHRNWEEASLRIGVMAPYRYDDFRGNHTVPLIYTLAAKWREDAAVERIFIANVESDYNLFRKYGIPAFGVEGKHSLKEFDVVLISLSFLPCWWNVLLLLRMSNIPLRWSERDESYPLFIVGGGAVYGNFAVAWPVVDAIFFGDAEEEEDGGLWTILSLIYEAKQRQWSRLDLLRMMQQKCDYIMVPRFYKPVYDKERFVRWEIEPGMPTKLRRRICKNLDRAVAYVRTMPSYLDTTMGLGEIESSRGCRAYCAYCSLGWTYRPYRERSPEVLKELFQESRRYSGAKTVCPVTAEFAYYSKKWKLIEGLAEDHRFVDPLSMRVDAFVSDEQFAKYVRKLGMNQAAVGIEGISQRLRNKLMKGITEEQILKACRLAMEAGYRRIKFFMIANVGETKEDWDEFFQMLTKVVLLKQQLKSSIVIKASWTPLFIEPKTPLQWMKPTLEQQQDWKWVAKKLLDLGVKFSLGAKIRRAYSWTTQAMRLGDTRFAEALLLCLDDYDVPFYMHFNPKFFEVLSSKLPLVSYSWDYIFREKEEDETFLWDIVDVGVSKETLLKFWRKIKSGEMERSVSVVKSSLDTASGRFPLRIEEEDLVNWTLFGYEFTDVDYEIVGSTYLEAEIRRACYLSDLPLSTLNVRFLGNRDNQNWYVGRDYVLVGWRVPFQVDEYIVRQMNEHLVHIRIVEWENLPRGKELTADELISVYKVETGLTQADLLNIVNRWKNRFKGNVKSLKTRYFAGQEVRDKALRFFDLKINPLEIGVLYISLAEGGPTVREILKSIFGLKGNQFIVKKIGRMKGMDDGRKVGDKI